MSPDLQAYYDGLLTMFMSAGWRTFCEDMEAGSEIVTLESCNSSDEFWKAKGKAEIYNRMLGYQDFIEQGYAEAEDAEDI